ncbi:MAG: putative quinol monooxygenase [Thalassobaculaceae bacterium]
MFVVTVNFSIKPGQIEQFRPLMLENARLSLELETGGADNLMCVLTPVNRRNAFLYEVYDNKSAFETHLQMAHFKSFDAKVAKMLDDKVVKTLSLVQGAVLTT